MVEIFELARVCSGATAGDLRESRLMMAGKRVGISRRGKFEPGTKIRQKAANFEPGTDLRRTHGSGFSRESADDGWKTRRVSRRGKFEPGTKIRQKAANFEPGTDLRRTHNSGFSREAPQ